ncbi:hypothetical protein [Hyphomicrobium sulfonivorans]|nr:hypothetical protein [Hyphomicrobium sulfonivorans]
MTGADTPMLHKGSPFLLAAAIIVLLVHACILIGGAKVAVVLCTFALMIGGPVALLIWLGSLPDLEERQRQRRRDRHQAHADAALWQQTLNAMQATYPAPRHMQHTGALAPANAVRTQPRTARAGAHLTPHTPSGIRRCIRPILALSAMVASAIGVAGCATEIPPEAWSAVRPGMKTAELVSLIGGPDYVRSNGAAEVWQYCRDSYGRDEGRNALYYTAILIDKQEIRDVKVHPVYSGAGCQEFYRASF